MATNNSSDYSPTQYNAQVGGASGTLVNVAPSATSGVPLISQGSSSNPAFGTALVAGGGTGATTFTSHGVLLGNTTSAITATAAGTTGQVLTGVTGSAPTFQSPAASNITITGDSGGGLTSTSFTFTGGTTGLTFAGAGTTETLGGTLAIANGGTNATSFTQSNGVVTYNGTRLVNYAGPQISSAGLATNTSQPAFFSYLSATQSSVTGDGTLYQIVFDGTTANQGSYYNAGAGLFTAPVTGLYFFSCAIALSGLTAQTNTTLIFHTVAVDYYTVIINPTSINAGGVLAFNTSIGPIHLNAAEGLEIQVQVSGSTKTVSVFGSGGPYFTYFSGFLVC